MPKAWILEFLQAALSTRIQEGIPEVLCLGAGLEAGPAVMGGGGCWKEQPVARVAPCCRAGAPMALQGMPVATWSLVGHGAPPGRAGWIWERWNTNLRHTMRRVGRAGSINSTVWLLCLEGAL